MKDSTKIHVAGDAQHAIINHLLSTKTVLHNEKKSLWFRFLHSATLFLYKTKNIHSIMACIQSFSINNFVIFSSARNFFSYNFSFNRGKNFDIILLFRLSIRGGFFFLQTNFDFLTSRFWRNFLSFKSYCCPELEFEKIFYLWPFFVKFKDCHFGPFGTINRR